MKTNYIISGVLGLAIVALFILHFTGGEKASDQEVVATSGEVTERLPIAYVQADTLLGNYKFALDLNESLLKKTEDKRGIYNKKRVAFEKEATSFYEKYQNNAFMTPERAQQEYERISKKEQDLMQEEQKMSQELGMEQLRMNQQLTDSIIAGIKLFNTPQKYDLILSNISSQTLLYADKAYDITQEVLDFLNARYVPED